MNKPIVILTLPKVSATAQQQLKALGAQLLHVDQMPFPSSVASTTKDCSYSKLHLWSLTQFYKVVYLDTDTMVQRVSVCHIDSQQNNHQHYKTKIKVNITLPNCAECNIPYIYIFLYTPTESR